MTAQRDIIARWVAKEILPHEPDVRAWLSRRWGSALDVDDVVQEAYCRIAALNGISHIENGRAYLFTTARSIAMDIFRRNRVAGAPTVTEIDLRGVEDEYPRADRTAEARQELSRIDAMLSTFSVTCRRVIELRRLHGLSQKETARQLGITENSVENHVTRGIRRVMRMLAEEEQGQNRQEAASLDDFRHQGTH